MNYKSIQPAIITPVLAAGSVASPYSYAVNISQRLCFPTCVANPPVFSPKFTIRDIALVGTGLYSVTIHVEGIINYVPCNSGCGCAKAQPLSQDFSILVASDDEPTVTLEQGNAVNAMAAPGCQQCSRAFVSECPITVTVATAAA